MTLHGGIKREDMVKNQWFKLPYPESRRLIATKNPQK